MCLIFFFLSFWTVDDRSPQLLISQYTCASIRKRPNTQACTHRHTSNSTSIFLKIYSVAQKQTLCWSDRLRNILRRDSTLLEQLHEDSSLMLQMHFQFESNQKDLFFPRRHYYYFMWVNLWVIERGRMDGEEDKQKSKQEASLIFNSPMKPNLPQQGIVLCQQGSMAATLMNMFWTISSILLAILN